MIEAARDGFAVTIARDELVVGADLKSVAIVRFDVSSEVGEEKVDEFGVFKI